MHEYRATVIRVVDGDTVDLDIDLGFFMTTRQRIRLAHIDAPEKRGQCKHAGIGAMRFLEKMLATEKPLYVRTTKTGKFGRWLGELWIECDAVSVNQQMIDTGHALPYEGGKRNKNKKKEQ